MVCLWAADRPLSPADVLDALDGGLAYTTVNTILMRLHAKGMVGRTKQGRGFRYEATVSEDHLTAQRMHDELIRTRNRTAALSQFVGSLSKRDAKALRGILDATDGDR